MDPGVLAFFIALFASLMLTVPVRAFALRVLEDYLAFTLWKAWKAQMAAIEGAPKDLR